MNYSVTPKKLWQLLLLHIAIGIFGSASDVYAQQIASTQFLNGFSGTTLSDNVQTTTFDGIYALNQSAGVLSINSVNATLFSRFWRTQFNDNKTIDLTNDGGIYIRVRSNRAVTLQFRATDVNGNSTGDHFSMNLTMPGDNNWREYTQINFEGRFAANRNFDPTRVRSIEILHYSNRAIANLNLSIDSIGVGKVAIGSARVSSSSFENDFEGQVLNDSVQVTTADGGSILTQQGFLRMRTVQFAPYRRFYETILRDKTKGFNMINDGNVRFRLLANRPARIQFRVADTAGNQTGDHFSVTIGVPGDSVWREYTINMSDRMRANNVDPRTIMRFSIWNYQTSNDYTGVILLDSLRIGREGCNGTNLTNTSWFSTFPCKVLNDNFYTVSADGSISLDQDEVLKVKFNNSNNYQKIEFTLRDALLDLSEPANQIMKVDVLGFYHLGLQFRLHDDRDINTGEANNRIFVGDTTWRTLTIDFRNQLGAGSRVNSSRIRRATIWNLTDALLADGNPDFAMWVDNLRIGSVVTNAFEPEEVLPIKMFPNPAKERFVIKTAHEERILKVRIFDTKGKMVRENKSLVQDISDFSPGLYLVQILSNGRAQTLKLIKE